MNTYSFSGKTVLVTGASMGIGEVFARELARQGARLILVARSADRLQKLAEELGGAQVIVADLAAPNAAQEVFDAVVGEVDVLINNAGFAAYGPFVETPLSTQRGQIAVNVTALVALTHLFLPMLERRQGGVIHVASTAAFQPVPYMAVYAASKAFVLSFSEALWGEYRDRGVRVVALCPGATDTPFFARAGEEAAFGAKASAEAVVALGLAAFQKNKPSVIHGAGNTITAWSSRLFSRAFVARLSARMMRPKPKTPTALPRESGSS